MLHFSYTPLNTHTSSLLIGFMAVVAWLALLPPPLQAQPETQHLINMPWRINPRVEVFLHSRFRTRPASQGLYQGRLGTWVGVKANPRVTAIAGYYFAEEEEVARKRDWEGLNRYFGGAEHLIAKHKGTWMGRHLAERFYGPNGKAYFRVRHRVGWEAPTRLQPYTNVEVFWDRHAWRSVRYQAGLRYKVTPRTSWDFHYFHEPRRQDVGWWSRNMWGSTLEVRLDDIEKRASR